MWADTFERWVPMQNWWPAFKRNYESQRDDEMTAEDYLLCHRDDQDEFIDIAFGWDATPEGFDYWHDINNRVNFLAG